MPSLSWTLCEAVTDLVTGPGGHVIWRRPRLPVRDWSVLILAGRGFLVTPHYFDRVECDVLP